MSQFDNKEFLFHETLPGEKLCFGKFSPDGRFFIFLTDEDRYLKSYLHAGSASRMQKLYLYSADKEPPALPPRPLDLDAARFTKFHVGEKFV